MVVTPLVVATLLAGAALGDASGLGVEVLLVLLVLLLLSVSGGVELSVEVSAGWDESAVDDFAAVAAADLLLPVVEPLEAVEVELVAVVSLAVVSVELVSVAVVLVVPVSPLEVALLEAASLLESAVGIDGTSTLPVAAAELAVGFSVGI